MNGASKICGRQPLKNFTWTILEYFVAYNLCKLEIYGFILNIVVVNFKYIWWTLWNFPDDFNVYFEEVINLSKHSF